MFTRCLVCQSPFPENEALEHFPRGDRLAYDPVKGRLWAVCRACRRWSLAPIEDRWEALDELEKIVRDRARLLSQTDNIALLEAPPLEIVRVGRANLAEESWWRYGRELRERRASYQKLSLAGSVAVGAAVVGGWATGAMSLVGMWILWHHAPDKVVKGARWLRFGGAAWRGDAPCPNCGWIFRDVRFKDRAKLLMLPAGGPHPDGAHDPEGAAHRSPGSGDPVLGLRCPRCGRFGDGGLVLRERDAERTLQRVLAYHHFDGASERRVRSATRLIEEAGSPRDLTRIVIRDGARLGDLQRTGAVALEIAANEVSEERLLELELAELEAHWRREEELAAIVDGELTPMPLLEQIRRRVRGDS